MKVAENHRSVGHVWGQTHMHLDQLYYIYIVTLYCFRFIYIVPNDATSKPAIRYVAIWNVLKTIAQAWVMGSHRLFRSRSQRYKQLIFWKVPCIGTLWISCKDGAVPTILGRWSGKNMNTYCRKVMFGRIFIVLVIGFVVISIFTFSIAGLNHVESSRHGTYVCSTI